MTKAPACGDGPSTDSTECALDRPLALAVPAPPPDSEPRRPRLASDGCSTGNGCRVALPSRRTCCRYATEVNECCVRDAACGASGLWNRMGRPPPPPTPLLYDPDVGSGGDVLSAAHRRVRHGNGHGRTGSALTTREQPAITHSESLVGTEVTLPRRWLCSGVGCGGFAACAGVGCTCTAVAGDRCAGTASPEDCTPAPALSTGVASRGCMSAGGLGRGDVEAAMACCTSARSELSCCRSDSTR